MAAGVKSISVGLGLVAIAMLLVLGASCRGEKPKHPSPTVGATDTTELQGYLIDVQRSLTQAYGQSERLLRIYDKETYVEGLKLNARRFRQGATEIGALSVPPAISAEHTELTNAVEAIAEALDESIRQIDRGEDWLKFAIDEPGQLSEAFDRQAAACHSIAAFADQAEVYDDFSCGAAPYFIEASVPSWAHQVFINTCCGGSDPYSSPYETYYGSDEPFERTVTAYRTEMAKRGFSATQQGDRWRFTKPAWDGCFYIEEVASFPAYKRIDAGDIAKLKDYSHAYFAAYFQKNFCDG